MSFHNNQQSKKVSNISERVQGLISCIDLKISEMNQASFDCFFLVNSIMKQNRNNAIDAINMVSEIFELAGEKGSPVVLKKLYDQMPLVKDNLNGLAEEINKSLYTLGIIKSNLQLLPEPFEKLAQNLDTLSKLLTEIKLTNVYKDRSFKSFTGDEALKINTAINKLKNSCPVFEENIFNIKSHIDSLYDELSKLKDFFKYDLQNEFYRISGELEKVETANEYLLKKRKPVNQLLEDFNKQASVIVEKIDYRNIIRTRLNHIQNTQKLILNELFNYSDSPANDGYENNDYNEVTKITSTQIDRLLFTHKEYNDSITRISFTMEQMGAKMSDMAKTLAENNDINWYLSQSDGLDQLFDEIHHREQSQLKKYMHASDDMVLVHKIIKELFDRFKDLEMIENTIEQQVVDRISFGNLLLSEDKETASLAQQILKVYAGNHFEKNKIRTLFLDSIQNLKVFIENKSVYIYGKKGLESINHDLENVRNNITELCGNMNIIGNHLLRITDKSQQIMDTGLNSFEKLSFYDFSQKDMNELIGQFEEINMLVKSQKPARLPVKNNVTRVKEMHRVFLPAKYS